MLHAVEKSSVRQMILQNLNDHQKKPVLDFFGQSVIIAAPGSGKTFTLANRVAYMIEEGVDPSKILLFTFTKKASNEIKERVHLYAGESAHYITMGTYHSFCVKLLRQYCNHIGWKTNFSIYDTTDSLNVIKKITKDTGINPRKFLNTISKYKDEMISPLTAEQNAKTEFEKETAHYYKVYQNFLKDANAFDFDDLIYQTIRLLKSFPEVLKEINNRYDYIIADEAQDSSKRDINLLLMLSGDKKNLCLIMDDEQAIYGFRGANINYVLDILLSLNFKKFTLEENYRSTKTIVNASREMIDKNIKQMDKTVFTNNLQGDKIIYYQTHDNKSEATQIAKIVMALTKNGSFNLNDIAILYRTNYMSRVIEDAFLKNKIKYTIRSGLSFYEKKEIKDIVSYLNFLLNPDDLQAFTRIINIPKRGIGEKTIEKILTCKTEQDYVNIKETNIIDLCKAYNSKQLSSFITLFNTMNHYINNSKSAKDIINELLTMLKYKEYLEETCEEENLESRLENIEELLKLADESYDLHDFIDNMTLNISNKDENEDGEPSVNMMTMHASKGMEFPVVILPGVNEGTIPYEKQNEVTNVEEERRLFYVAMTRAKKNLFILRPNITFFKNRPIPSKESRFLKDIPSNLLVSIKA